MCLFYYTSRVLCHPSLPTSVPARARVCVYIKLIDEQFIRLMGSAGADKLPATRSGFKIQPEFAAARHRPRQRCSMTPQPL